jgi:hypothetical protein
MNSLPTTINQLFLSPEELSTERLSPISSGEAVSSLKEKITGAARVKWPVVFDMVIGKISDITDIKVIDIIGAAWSKYRSLLKYLDRGKYPPGETYLVALAEHTIKSEHHPCIDILINNETVGTIKFDIAVSFTLEGIVLKIRDGKIREVLTGTCRGQGTFKCEDCVILEKKIDAIPLPGAISLGEGVSITPG